MKTGYVLALVAGLALASCGSKEQSSSSAEAVIHGANGDVTLNGKGVAAPKLPDYAPA